MRPSHMYSHSHSVLSQLKIHYCAASTFTWRLYLFHYLRQEWFDSLVSKLSIHMQTGLVKLNEMKLDPKTAANVYGENWCGPSSSIYRFWQSQMNKRQKRKWQNSWPQQSQKESRSCIVQQVLAKENGHKLLLGLCVCFPFILCSALQLTLKSYINCTSNFLTWEIYTQRRNYLEKTQLNILEWPNL